MYGAFSRADSFLHTLREGYFRLTLSGTANLESCNLMTAAAYVVAMYHFILQISEIEQRINEVRHSGQA